MRPLHRHRQELDCPAPTRTHGKFVTTLANAPRLTMHPVASQTTSFPTLSRQQRAGYTTDACFYN